MFITTIYVWHDGAEEWDEVLDSDHRMTKTQARALAFSKLLEDDRSTRVQVEYLDGKVEEAARLQRQVRRLRALAQREAS